MEGWGCWEVPAEMGGEPLKAASAEPLEPDPDNTGEGNAR